MRAAASYDVLTVDGTATVVEVRPSHWLQLERSGDAIGTGSLEQVLRAIHIASGDDGAFDAWVDTLARWALRDEDEAADADRPTEAQPKPSPA